MGARKGREKVLRLLEFFQKILEMSDKSLKFLLEISNF